MHNKSLLRKKKLTEREAYVLLKLYDFEDPKTDMNLDLALELKVSSERIRQIGVKALKKLRKPSLSDPIQEMKTIIQNYAIAADQNDIFKTTVRFSLLELSDFPAQKVIRLIICTCLPFKKNLSETLDYCKYLSNTFQREYNRLNQQAKKKREKDERFIEFLNSNVIWFDKIKKWEKSHFNEIESKRTIKADIRYKSGLFYSKKMKKEIQYESGAELEFIEQLESSSLIAAYVEQPVTIKYIKNKKEYLYTPDFAVLLNNGCSFITEIKGSFESLMDAGVHRNIEQLLSYCQEYGFGLLLSCKLRSFEYFVECPINKKLELKILGNFKDGRRVIFLNEFKAILEETGASKKEALALILHNNWGYY
ncbi:hypothetical protein DBR28_18170, partial [Chryseobacterium sp. HMWF028]